MLLFAQERFLMEQDKLNETLSKELLQNSMVVYKKTVKSYLDGASQGPRGGGGGGGGGGGASTMMDSRSRGMMDDEGSPGRDQSRSRGGNRSRSGRSSGLR